MLVVAGGCGAPLAVWSAPDKKPSVARRTPAAQQADQLFWETFHNGAYEGIPQSLAPLKAAYLRTPTIQSPPPASASAHLADYRAPPDRVRARKEITDDAILARRYFQEAVRLDPSDARYLGFFAALPMREGRSTRTRSSRGAAISRCGTPYGVAGVQPFTAGYAGPSRTIRRRSRKASRRSGRTSTLPGRAIDRVNPDYANT